MATNHKEVNLFNYEEDKLAGTWRPITDTVMGGLSQGQMVIDEQGKASFEGVVSLDNNGGFASIRSTKKEFDLRGYAALSFRVKGDGRNYKISIKNDRAMDGIYYYYDFSTQKDKWIVIHASWDDFVPRYRGRVIPDAPPLNLQHIQSIGFMISDKQEGPFKLEIDSIHAVNRDRREES